jgi:hypothetical protein
MSGRGRLPAGFLDVLDAVGWFANRSEGSLPGRFRTMIPNENFELD